VGALDYTFGILGDCSSSMGELPRDELGNRVGDKKWIAQSRAIVLLGEALEKSGISWFVLPWESTLRERKPIHHPISRHKAQIGADLTHPSGGTYEAAALVAAQEEFARVRSGHRVLFVLSDGETLCKDESELLLDELEDMGVRVIAIGVGIPAPEHHRIQVSLESPEELTEILPRLVNEVVKKGRM
jgi:hypothetical protein